MLARPIPINSRLLPCIAIAALFALLSACSSTPQTVVERPRLVIPAPPEEPKFYFEQAIRHNGDVIDLNEDQKMMLYLSGGQQSVSGFGKLFDVASHNGRIFVTDTQLRDVMIIDKKAQIFKSLKKTSGTQFAKPLGIATDAIGNVYVVDNKEEEIFLFDRDGTALKSIKIDKAIKRPSGIDVTPDGSRLFLVAVGGIDTNAHHVAVIDTASGKVIKLIGTRGTGDGEFNLPKDVALGPDGLLYVVDSGNFRISVLDQEGNFIRSFGKIGTQLGAFSRPKGIAIDSHGNVYVVDAGFGNIQIFNKEGQLLLVLGARSSRGDRAEYMLPSGLDIDEKGAVYIVDQYLRKVEIYTPHESIAPVPAPVPVPIPVPVPALAPAS